MKWITLSLIVTVLGLLALFSSLGVTWQTDSSQSTTTPLDSCVVLVVYDGDTFGCDMDGDGRPKNTQEHIRLLGIDTPEMHYSKKNKTGQNEFMAAESSAYLTRRILKKRVYLEYDTQRFDRYGRRLAYIYLESDRHKPSINAELLEQGLASTLFLGQNRRYEASFITMEHTAQTQQRGLWSQ